MVGFQDEDSSIAESTLVKETQTCIVSFPADKAKNVPLVDIDPLGQGHGLQRRGIFFS